MELNGVMLYSILMEEENTTASVPNNFLLKIINTFNLTQKTYKAVALKQKNIFLSFIYAYEN